MAHECNAADKRLQTLTRALQLLPICFANLLTLNSIHQFCENTMKQLISLFFVTVLLSACGTSSNIVMQSSTQLQNVRAIQLAEATHTVEVPAELRNHLRETLEQNLFDEHNFEQGKDLTLEYRFIAYKHGSRLKRFLADSTGSWGEGSMIVHTRFLDSNGELVAETETLGRIDSGIFGGGIKDAADRVADDVAQFAASSFK